VPPAKPVAVRPPADEVAALVRRVSAVGSVLLSNDGTLPLDPAKVKRLAVLGPQAAAEPGQGGGSANLRPDYVVTPLDGLRAAFPNAEILWNPDERLRPGAQWLKSSEVRLPAAAGANAGKPGILIRVFESAGGPVTGVLGREVARAERRDGRVNWAGDAVVAGRPLFEMSMSVVSEVTGHHRIGCESRGQVAVYIDGVLAVEAGEATDAKEIDAIWHEPPFIAADVDMVAGKPVDVAIRWQKFHDLPAVITYISMDRPVPSLEEICAEDERLARQADAVVLVLGTTFLDESEGSDRKSLALNPAQDALARRVAEANPRTIVVVAAGSPVLMPWREDVAALLLTWFPGQEAGNALADMVTGKVEPGGRMPTTWPAETEDVPVIDTKPVDGMLRYEEGLNIGYRAWLASEVQPAFPFGHGLGYTRWTYLDAEPAKATIDVTDDSGALLPATVSVRVRNAGERRGKDVVQLYLARSESKIERPLLWLAGWAHVEADPGQEVEVAVPIDRWAARYWDESAGAWAIEPGIYDVRIGRSVGDLRLATVLDVEAR
jgi:beta-glucosidase